LISSLRKGKDGGERKEGRGRKKGENERPSSLPQ
jgi:hypothetical protein